MASVLCPVMGSLGLYLVAKVPILLVKNFLPVKS